MSIKVQLLSFVASFVYGVISLNMYLILNRFLTIKRKAISALLRFILILLIFILYFILMYFVNNAVLHIYFIFAFFIGFILSRIVYNVIKSSKT